MHNLLSKTTSKRRPEINALKPSPISSPVFAPRTTILPRYRPRSRPRLATHADQRPVTTTRLLQRWDSPRISQKGDSADSRPGSQRLLRHKCGGCLSDSNCCQCLHHRDTRVRLSGAMCQKRCQICSRVCSPLSTTHNTTITW